MRSLFFHHTKHAMRGFSSEPPSQKSLSSFFVLFFAAAPFVILATIATGVDAHITLYRKKVLRREKEASEEESAAADRNSGMK